jgi:hypothetical protein
MDIAASPRKPLLTAAALAVLLFVAFVAAGKSLYFDSPALESGDGAVNALQIDQAKSGRELYGNYSRFQFNHPGPAFFYVYAGAEIVLHDWLGWVPSPTNAHQLASLALQVGFFALALALLLQWFASPWLLPLALLGAAWHFTQAHGSFMSLWPPHVLLMPFLCFLTAACSVAAGRTRDLIFVAISGGFLFHGHVAQPLFVGGLGALALVMHHRTRGLSWRDIGPEIVAHRRLVWLCAAWALLLLLPLAIDVLAYGRESNVATILGRFQSNASEGKSIFQSFLYFLSFTTYSNDQENVFTTLGAVTGRFFVEHAFSLLLWAVIVAVPAWLFHRRRAALPEATQRFIASAYLCLLATVALCVVWGLMQAGPMYQFNGFFYYGIYYFAAILGLGVVLTLFPIPARSALVTGALCLAAIGFTRGFTTGQLSREESGLDARDAVARLLQENPNQRPKLLVFEHEAWPTAAAIALELQRRDVTFYAAHSWDFMFGRRHNLQLLGAAPESVADVWWLGRASEGGVPVRGNLRVFRRPPAVDPRGTTISFGLNQNAFRHVLSGLSTGNVDSAGSEQPVIRFAIETQPTVGDVQLIFDLAASNSPRQRVQVRWNGAAVGEFVVSATRAQPTLTIPATLWNASRRATLELLLPDAVPVTFSARPSLHQWDAIRLWHLWFASESGIEGDAAAATGPTQFDLNGAAPAERTFTHAINPAGDRLEFRHNQRGSQLAATGLGKPGDTQTPIEDQHAVLIFRPLPASQDVLLEIVALPYTTGPGKPPNQRCQLLFNGELIFEAPFTEPGVIRALVSKALWNARPFAVIQLVLPDATPAPLPPNAPGADVKRATPQHGLALRWLTVRPPE